MSRGFSFPLIYWAHFVKQSTVEAKSRVLALSNACLIRMLRDPFVNGRWLNPEKNNFSCERGDRSKGPFFRGHEWFFRYKKGREKSTFSRDFKSQLWKTWNSKTSNIFHPCWRLFEKISKWVGFHHFCPVKPLTPREIMLVPLILIIRNKFLIKPPLLF